jgi:cytoskeletal protein RodZ
MTKSGFGEHLKREREMRGVSREEIAGATRISTRFLEALEKEEWDRLPGGVFNRGFVRTVGRFLGLDEESLMAEYALAIGQPAPASAEPPPQPAPSRKAPWIALSVAAAVALGVGAWAGWLWFGARQAELNAVASAAPPRPAPPSVPPATLAPPEPATTPLPSSHPESPWAAPPAGPDTVATPWGSTPASALQLKISADKETSLTVTQDGQQAFSGRILAGESHSFAAADTLTIQAQDAGAIRLELNGEALAPIGLPGQPGKVTLGRRDPEAGAGGPN